MNINVVFILSLLQPLVGTNPLRSSAAIYMYVTESMIKFLPLSFFKQSAKPLHVNPHRELLYFYLILHSALFSR